KLVNNGLEAMEELKKNNYNLLFMDIHMPILDGIESTKIINSSFPIEKRPIIFALTASASWEDKLKCEQVGMKGHLSKPVTIADLKKVLKNVYEMELFVT